MKRLLLFALLLAAARPAVAHQITTRRFTCPICEHAFYDFTSVHTYLYCGRGPELRWGSYVPAGRYTFFTCPKCYYSGLWNEFQHGEKTPTMSTCLKIREALKKLDKRDFQPPPLLLLDRVRLTAYCKDVAGATPRELAYVYVVGAWAADYAGEDAWALTFRAVAIAEMDKALAARPQEKAQWALEMKVRRAGMCDAAYEADRAVKLCRQLVDELKLRTAEAEQRYEKTWGKKSDDEKLDDLAFSDEQQAKQGAKRKINSLRYMRGLVRGRVLRADFEKMSEADARKRADTADLAVRVAFLKVHGASLEAKTVTLIRRYFWNPVGPPPEADPLNDAPYLAWQKRVARTCAAFRRAIWISAGEPGTLEDFKCDYPVPKEPKEYEDDEDDEKADMAALAKQLRVEGASDLAKPPAKRFSHIWFPPTNAPADKVNLYSLMLKGAAGGLTACKTVQAARLLLADMARRPSYYFHSHWPSMPFGWFDDGLDSTAALDELGAVAFAVKTLDAHEAGRARDVAVLVALGPLGRAERDATLAPLRRAAKSKSAEIRLVAANCLIERKQPLGADVLLAEAVRRKRWPGLGWHWPKKILPLLDKADLAVLRTLRGQAGPAPSWAMAALAKHGTPKDVAAYDAFALDPKRDADERYVSDFNWHDPDGPAERDPRSHAHAVARLAEMHCSDRIGAFLLRAALTVPDSGRSLIPSVLAILGQTPAQHDRCRQLIVKLLPRPTPMSTKLAVIGLAERLDAPGLTKALKTWSKSKNERLSQAAAKALAARDKRQKK